MHAIQVKKKKAQQRKIRDQIRQFKYQTMTHKQKDAYLKTIQALDLRKYPKMGNIQDVRRIAELRFSKRYGIPKNDVPMLEQMRSLDQLIHFCYYWDIKPANLFQLYQTG